MESQLGRRARASAVLVAGLLLLVVGTLLTRVHAQPWCEYWYALVWLGFILTGEAVMDLLTGASLLFDRPRLMARMFTESAALWWLFEIANALAWSDWRYSSSPDVPAWVQVVRSTIFFSMLLPATWVGMTLGALALQVRPARRPAVPRRVAGATAGAGVAAGALLAAGVAPDLRLPVGLVALILLVDGVNALGGRPSLLARLLARDARFFAALLVSNLALGLLSEAWNHRATPRWTYDAPYAGDASLFGMPLLGYLGYVALAMALFALHHLFAPRAASSPTLVGHPSHALST